MIGAELVQHGNDDLLIVNAARVSFGKRKVAFDEKDANLLRFLHREGHWTPFGHPDRLLKRQLPLEYFARHMAECGAGHEVVIQRITADGDVVFWERGSMWFWMRNKGWLDALAWDALRAACPAAWSVSQLHDPCEMFDQSSPTLADMSASSPEERNDGLRSSGLSVAKAARLVSLTFHIRAPVFVARQLAKHQVGLVWNEISRRYVHDEPDFFFPDTWRRRAANKKQGSSVDSCLTQSFVDLVMRDAIGQARSVYMCALAEDVAPEQARMVLPHSTMTEWFWTGSVAAFARVVALRTAGDAQAETRETVAGIREALQAMFPGVLKEAA
jgi:flavin-dependent thymidylate synthase